jgi:PAS domain S-box-containing protein
MNQLPWSRRGGAALPHERVSIKDAAARVGRAVPWLVLLCSLLTGGMLTVALLYLKAEATRSGEVHTLALAQVIAEQTGRTLQTVDERLQLAATRLQALQAAGGLNERSGRALLRDQLKGLPFVRAIWVLDADGRVVLDSNEGNIGMSLADRPYFQAHKAAPHADFIIGPLLHSRVDDAWMISASRRLRMANSPQGLIVAAVEPIYFEQLWRGIGLGEHGVIGLFGRAGQLMMRSPRDEAAMGHDFSHLPVFRQLLASGRGTFVSTSPLDGKTRVNAFQVLNPYANLVVLVGADIQAVLAPWRRFATLSAGLWALAVLAASALAMQLQRQAREHEANELRFGQLAQAMPQIVFVATPRGAVRFLNHQWAEATGHPVRDGLGAGWQALIHPDDHVATEQLSRMLEAGNEGQVELRLLCRDGRYRWQLLRSVPVRDHHGQVLRWYGTSTDIDDLKQAQARLIVQAEEIGRLNLGLEQKIAQRTAELARQEALFRTLAEQAPLPIWMVDTRGAITFLSRAWYELVGGEAPRWYGYEWMELVHPDDLPEVQRNWIESSKTGMPHTGQRRIRALDGSYHTTTFRATPVRGQGGEILFWVGVDTDITEIIANETALRLANEQLEAFSYSVSHDLQSPLQRINAFAQLLQGAIHASPESKVQHYLSRIRANADFMRQLIEGLLSLAQVSRVEVIRGTVNLSELAGNILERLQAEQPERGVRWRVEPGLVVTGDARLMRSVMENLLGNAWKFTRRQPRAEIVVGQDTDRGAYFVRDNGAGFDMAFADKLFGTFQRLHRDDEFEGTGIGLATVARAVSRQGGEVWATSEPGQGATFYFTLPPAPAAAPVEPPPAPSQG